MVIAIPLLITLVGLVVYLISSHAKAAELGRLAFGAGLLVSLFGASGHALHF